MAADDLINNDLIDEAVLRVLFAGLARFRSILLAVSGGSDSMALMHMAARWQVAVNAAPGNLIVATIDHGLRQDSAQEATFVAAEAGKLGLDHTILIWRGQKPGSGIQAAAREARYALLTDYARKRGCEAIVTAHTLDDQAETFLMRLARGSGVDGLAAMLPATNRDGVALLRPLLGMPKYDLQRLLQGLGGSWIEDPSNDNAGFERVRIRQALQLLDDVGVEATSLAASAERLARARVALEAGTAALVSRAVTADITGLVKIDRARFAEAPQELALRLLGRAVSLSGGGQAVRLGRLEAVLTAISRAEATGVTLAGAMIRSRAKQIQLTREALRGPLPVAPIAPGGSLIWDGRFRVCLDERAPEGLEVRALGPDAANHAKSLAGAARKLPPRELLATMPGFWRGDELVAAPQLCVAAGQQARVAEQEKVGQLNHDQAGHDQAGHGQAGHGQVEHGADPCCRRNHYSVAFLAHQMQLAPDDGGEWPV